jgi:hypothetical protein
MPPEAMVYHVQMCSAQNTPAHLSPATIDLSSPVRAAGGLRSVAAAETDNATKVGGAYRTLEGLMSESEKYLKSRADNAGRDPRELDTRYEHLEAAVLALKAALFSPDAAKKPAALTACIVIETQLREKEGGVERAIEVAMSSQQKPVNLVLSNRGGKKSRFSSTKK